MKPKLIIAILATILVFLVGAFGKLAISSTEASASIAQVRTGENAVLERSFIQSNSAVLVPIIQGILLLAWIPVLTYKEKK